MKTLLILLLLSSTLFAGSITGKVVSVADGDTITVLDSSKTQHKIRFEHIDTPEKKQAFGQKAKQHLSKMVFGKTVKVSIKEKDRYGRSIGTVYLGKKNINLEMVKAGFAWHYKAYSKDKTFADAETKAKKAKIGLWADKNPVAPWEYRRGGKSSTKKIPSKDKGDATSNGQVWITKSSGIWHNSSCRYFKNSKGYLGLKSKGKRACKICGG